MPLNSTGGAQAAAVSSQIARLTPAPEVLVVSPLTRALQTAQLAYAHHSIPCVVHPLIAEHCEDLYSLGRPASELQQEFHPRYDFSDLEEDWWAATYPGEKWESSGDFHKRMSRFRAWLLSRPEQCIGVVSHWCCIMALTGQDAENCEIVTVTSDRLKTR